MLTHVEFRSDRFPACPGEEEQINPGIWGKRLAEFLCERLPAEGFEVKRFYAEDWGWEIELVNKGFGLWIGCGNYQEYPDGYLCFIDPHEPYVRRFFKRIDTRERVEALQRALDRILSEDDGIRAKRWWTHEEFNNPGRVGRESIRGFRGGSRYEGSSRARLVALQDDDVQGGDGRDRVVRRVDEVGDFDFDVKRNS
jgi:hypothetical protein